MDLLRRLLRGRIGDSALTGYVEMATVMSGTLSRNLLRGVFKLLLFGFLAPQAMGVLRAVYAFFKIVTGLVGFGLDHAMVSLVSAGLGRGNERDREQILRTVLNLKLLTIGSLLVLGNLIAPWLTQVVFGEEKFAIYTRLALLAVGGQLLWKYISSYFAAHQQFGRLAVFLVTVPALMLAGAITLIVSERLTTHWAILLMLFAPGVAALSWAFALDRRVIGPWSAPWIRRILAFSRWIYLSRAASAGRNHLNPLLIKNPVLAGSARIGEINAGLYSFGSDLAAEITVFTESLLNVLLPKASGKRSPAALRRFVARSYRHMVVLIVPLGLLVFAAKPMILLLGRISPNYLEYLPSLKIFVILYLGSLFSVLGIPMQTALYAMRTPQVEAYLEIATVALLAIGALLVIPHHGAVGAAIVVFVQRVVYFVGLMTIGLVRLRRLKGETL